jgi:hypothetical protein
MYRRGTSVAVHDLERELSNLLPIDDYFDERDHKRKHKKHSSKAASGQKASGKVEINIVNVEPTAAEIEGI